MAKNYVAGRLITHGVSGELIEPGEKVDVSHLDDEAVANLEERGVLVSARSSEGKALQSETKDESSEDGES